MRPGARSTNLAAKISAWVVTDQQGALRALVDGQLGQAGLNAARQALASACAIVWTVHARMMATGGTSSTASACSTNAPDCAAPFASGTASVTA